MAPQQLTSDLESPFENDQDPRCEVASAKSSSTPVEKKPWQIALLCILIATAISSYWGISIGIEKGLFLDFKAVYVGASSLVEGHNPYSSAELSKLYRGIGGL